MSRTVMSVLLVVLSGCSAFGPDTPEADVTFETTAAAYAPGDDVTARLANGSDGTIGYSYNLCDVSFEPVDRGGAVSWARGACSLVASTLGPGDAREETRSVPTALPPGRYRLVTSVTLDEGQGREVEVASPPFRVQ